MRQINKLGEDRLTKYNYTSVPDQSGKFISKVELPGKEGAMYTFGFKYNQGASNIEGLFSTMDNLELENSTVTIMVKKFLSQMFQQILISESLATKFLLTRLY